MGSGGADGDAAVSEELKRQLAEQLVDLIPSIVYVKDLKTKRYLLVNRAAARVMGSEPQDILGKADHELFPDEVIAEWRRRDAQVLASGDVLTLDDEIPTSGGTKSVLAALVPLRNDAGEIWAVAGISSDITELKRAEEEKRRLQQRVIDAQRDALRQLSTPLIPISDAILALPLIGVVDRVRAEHMLEALLEGVVEREADVVIIDITGVPEVDAAAADALIRATQAVRLVGAQVVLTGVQPQSAQALAAAVADGAELITLGTLQDGIAYAMDRLTDAGN